MLSWSDRLRFRSQQSYRPALPPACFRRSCFPREQASRDGRLNSLGRHRLGLGLHLVDLGAWLSAPCSMPWNASQSPARARRCATGPWASCTNPAAMPCKSSAAHDAVSIDLRPCFLDGEINQRSFKLDGAIAPCRPSRFRCMVANSSSALRASSIMRCCSACALIAATGSAPGPCASLDLGRSRPSAFRSRGACSQVRAARPPAESAAAGPAACACCCSSGETWA
jgi:hypothetical protein